MAVPCAPETTHGTAVALGGRGLLILGPSGSGKSGLALRLLALGAELVADDRVALRDGGHAVLAEAPEALRGRIEARFLGILHVQTVAGPVPLHWVVDLAANAEERLPREARIGLCGHELPLIRGGGVPGLDAVLTLLLRGGRLER